MPDTIDAGSQTQAGASDTQINESTSTSTPEPSGPISLTDDALITWEGAKEPVKFSNLRGLQSQFTKVSQAKAKYERDLRERDQQIQQLRTAIQQAQGRKQQQSAPDPFADLKQLPYLKGEEAAGLAQSIFKELSTRDQILQVMAQKIAQMEQGFGTIRQERTAQQFDRQIKDVLQELDLDPEYLEDAKAYYLAHEGDDLDEKFPEMYKAHVEKRRAIEARIAQRRRETARQTPFVPGKGGKTAANRELDFAGKSAKEQADMLWDSLQASST